MTDTRGANPWLVLLGLALGVLVTNGFGRFAYGLILPAMKAELGWTYAQAGWLNTANAMDYDQYDRSFAGTARRYEPGAHAMVGVVGMAAALELLLEEGLDRIEPQVEALAGRLADGVRSAGVAVASPHNPGRGSGIVAIRPPAGIDLQAWFAAIQEHGVRGAVRRGFLRLSPHFYNTAEQIDQAIAGVAAARARMA